MPTWVELTPGVAVAVVAAGAAAATARGGYEGWLYPGCAQVACGAAGGFTGVP